MARYGQIFKDKAVARLLPPQSTAVEVVAREVGVAVGTLQRWLDDVQSMSALGRVWTERHQANAATFPLRYQLLAPPLLLRYSRVPAVVLLLCL